MACDGAKLDRGLNRVLGSERHVAAEREPQPQPTNPRKNQPLEQFLEVGTGSGQHRVDGISCESSQEAAA